jgi:hypothetical protein
VVGKGWRGADQRLIVLQTVGQSTTVEQQSCNGCKFAPPASIGKSETVSDLKASVEIPHLRYLLFRHRPAALLR